MRSTTVYSNILPCMATAIVLLLVLVLFVPYFIYCLIRDILLLGREVDSEWIRKKVLHMVSRWSNYKYQRDHNGWSSRRRWVNRERTYWNEITPCEKTSMIEAASKALRQSLKESKHEGCTLNIYIYYLRMRLKVSVIKFRVEKDGHVSDICLPTRVLSKVEHAIRSVAIHHYYASYEDFHGVESIQIDL